MRLCACMYVGMYACMRMLRGRRCDHAYMRTCTTSHVRTQTHNMQHVHHLLPLDQPVTPARLAVLFGEEAALLRLVVEGVLFQPCGDRRPAHLGESVGEGEGEGMGEG